MKFRTIDRCGAGGEGPSLRYCARNRGRRPRTQRRLAERFACCRSTLVVECDDVSSLPLAICRKSSQNASSKALVLCPATLERLMIEDFMAVGRTVSDLVASIDADRQGGDRNLSSAIRLFVLDFYRSEPNPQSGPRERFAA